MLYLFIIYYKYIERVSHHPIFFYVSVQYYINKE